MLHERIWSHGIIQHVIPLICNIIFNIQNRQFSRDQKPVSTCLGLRGRWKQEGDTDWYWEYLKITL